MAGVASTGEKGDDEDGLFIPLRGRAKKIIAGMEELAFPGENHGFVLANINRFNDGTSSLDLT